MEYLIDFRNMEWENPVTGIRSKTFIKGVQKVRCVEFSDAFVEDGWCKKGHIGYVLEGEIKIDFNGESAIFQKGDGLCIPAGEEHKHRATVAKGEKAILVFFEEV
jgi:glyoxylate utilization-related uncharacterized protein